uniref:Uncharacterized protein n=1 Tax=Eutreptiella gymnastica TaxID=73025 RepID=A0A7S1IKR6_9EUGL|mmetsp:Transcript_25093/g.45392  ORF Transcript_25093/g.45392 Transcript_25093/m.45392 type:complete len:685 (+) Transcript_25093:145-2199(+)
MTGPPPSPRPSTPSLQYSNCSSPAFSRVYEEQILMKEEAMRTLLEKREAQFAKDCTFKPVINKYTPNTRHEDAFTRLSRDKKDYRRLEQERQQREAKEREECSFRPQINSHAGRRMSADEGARRLHLSADQRQWNLQRRREEQERQQQEWFQPKINELSRATAEADSRAPIHERIDELQRDRQVKLHKLSLQAMEQQDATFRPQINQTSKEIVQLQQQMPQYSDRQSDTTGSQYEEQVRQQYQTMTRLQEEDTQRYLKECPFKPKLNANSERIVQHHAAFRSQSFAERQMLFARQARGKLDHAVQRVAGEEEQSFQPELGKTTRLLTQAKRDAESTEEKLARLAMRDKEKTEELREELKEQYYSQFPFQPKLNKISRALVDSKDSTRDVTQSKTRHINDELLLQLEEDFKNTCTFRPVIYSTGPLSHREQGAYNQTNAAEKARRLAEAKRQQEYEELKDCTFQPKLKKSVPNFAQQRVEVPGMAKYLDRRQQAQCMKEEQKKREDQAFKVKGARKPDHRYTVPQPFKLHTQYHSLSKKEKLEASLKAKAEKDCTFTPVTNSKVAYDILRRYILSDDRDSDDGDFDEEEYEGIDFDSSNPKPNSNPPLPHQGGHVHGTPNPKINPYLTQTSARANPSPRYSSGFDHSSGASTKLYSDVSGAGLEVIDLEEPPEYQRATRRFFSST